MRAYSERLSVPPAWWLIGGATTVLLGAELWAGFGVLAAVATYAVLAIVVGGTLLHWGSARVRVTDGELRAGAGRLALSAVGEVLALDERQARAMRGQHADPAAHLVIRPYLRRAVYVEVTDPGQPTPYWLVGTRRPEELAAAVRTGAAASAESAESAASAESGAQGADHTG